MSDYEFIPIVYPNKEPNTEVPKPLRQTYDIASSVVVPGMGLPFIASAPYVAPEPVPAPKPLPQSGVLIDTAGTLVYHPLSALPATTMVATGIPMSTPPLISHFSGSEPLYAPYTSGGDPVGSWSTYPAISTVDISGNSMENVGDMIFIPGSSLRDMDEISLTAGGFGSLTLNALGIQSAGDITGINTLELNDQVLTAQPTALLLNGVPIATISDLPNIYEWANYPSISSILMEEGNGIQNTAFLQFDTSKQLTSVENPTPVGTTRLVYDGNIICSTDFTGAYKATGVSTGVPQWATFLAIQDVNWNSKQITNINKIAFNTAVPGLGNAAISAVNTIGFALTAGAATTAAIRDLNRLEFWNPLFPGVPGAQINLGTNAQGKLYTDVRFECPTMLLDSATVDVGPGAGVAARYMIVNNNPCPSFWWQFPAAGPINIANNILNGVNTVQLAVGPGGPFCRLTTNALGELLVNNQPIRPITTWSTVPAIQDVNFADFSIDNISEVNFGATNTLDVIGTTLRWRGEPIATGDVTPALWANYGAVNNVEIPKEYTLQINPEDGLLEYNDCHWNTNIYHGVSHFIDPNPDFVSYPTNFEVNRARAISLNTDSLEPLISGIGLNSVTTVNIDAGELIFINSLLALEMLAGGTCTINAIGLLTMEGSEANMTAGAITINGAATVQIGGASIEITAPIAANIIAGELNITAGATTVETGATIFTTGISTWTSPAWSLASAATTIAGFQMTIASGNLNITSGTTTIASGTTAITSPIINIPVGKVFVNEIDAYTTDSLILKGAKTINGATTGLVMTDVASIAGQGSGMNLTNIANFEQYSATNVLLPCKTFFTPIAPISLVAGDLTLVYTSPPKIWSWPNIPFLSFAVSITGLVSNGGTATPSYLSGYIQLKNLTQPGRTLTLATPNPTAGFIEYEVVSKPVKDTLTSMYNITYNFSYLQSGDFVTGNSYEVQVYLRNQELGGTLSLTGSYLEFNVHNAGAL